MSRYIIKTTALYHRFAKDMVTLSDINIEVERGSVYGFLGPNGSGKTTTLSLLLGLLNRQEGDIEIFGEHLHESRTGILKKTGSLIEAPSLYGQLSATENLEIYRRIYGVPSERVGEVLEIVNLRNTGRKAVKKFSLGMRQRLSIALALLPNPELLILDEPSNGLDPAGIIELRELIKKLNRELGMTILISSHLLGEIEKMVSHVGIIFKGKMLFQGPLQELQHFQRQQLKLMVDTSDNQRAADLLRQYGPQVCENGLQVPYSHNGQVAEIAKTLIANQLDLYLLQPVKPELEQLFIDMTSETASL